MPHVDVPAIVASLVANARVIAAQVSGVSDAQARWKPEPGKWSILEVVTHLADEEVEDFRSRVGSTLSDPQVEWPAIDPEGWAVRRRYNEPPSPSSRGSPTRTGIGPTIILAWDRSVRATC
jgi:hypothetical protein